MVGSMSFSNDRVSNGAFCATLLHQLGNKRWMSLKAVSMCAMLCWAGEVPARTCADLYNVIKSEAMYCGFFCDLGKLQQSQKAYEASCIRIVLPPSLFDLDSVPQELAPLADRSDLTARTVILEGDVLPGR